jgi:hypothetical protein
MAKTASVMLKNHAKPGAPKSERCIGKKLPKFVESLGRMDSGLGGRILLCHTNTTSGDVI